MDRKEIDALLRLMRRHGVESFRYNPQAGELEVHFVTAGGGGTPVAAAAPTPAPPAPVAPPKATEGRGIRSPIVGTFYRAPAPDAEPYVRIGDHVRKGQVVCIVEAMKLMNQIESDVDGVIGEILVENGKPVQFGQELFRLVAG